MEDFPGSPERYSWGQEPGEMLLFAFVNYLVWNREPITQILGENSLAPRGLECRPRCVFPAGRLGRLLDPSGLRFPF